MGVRVSPSALSSEKEYKKRLPDNVADNIQPTYFFVQNREAWKTSHSCAVRSNVGTLQPSSKKNAFAHLSARGKWIDGKTIAIATEVESAFVVEYPDLKCEVDLDKEGWITVIVHGPGEIPPRALVSIDIRADMAHVCWLAETPQKMERKAVTRIFEDGIL